MSDFRCDDSDNGRDSYEPGSQPCEFVTLHPYTAMQKEEKGIEQIEFEDDDDSMRKMYEEECAKNGVKVDM